LGGDLRAFGGEFRGVQFRDQLARLEEVAFRHVQRPDPSPVTGRHVNLIGLDRAGNSV
jgi:hypothetical protein